VRRRAKPRRRVAVAVASLAGMALLSLPLATAPALATSPALRFAPGQHAAAGDGPWLLSVGDVVGNGRSDLAVANIFGLGPNGASLLMNTVAAPGAPDFAPPIGFDALGAQAPLLADFSGSGLPDLVVCDEPALPVGRCRVYPNLTRRGAKIPTFGPPVVLPTPDTPEVLAAADMTGDGKLDLVISNFASLGPDAITIFPNASTPGHLSFAPAQNFTGGVGAEGMAVVDLNGDGKPDIVTGNTAGNNVTALVNETTTGSSVIRLSAPQVLPATSGPTAVVAADFNGDGKLDLAVGSSFTPTAADLNVYMNQTPPGSETLRFTHQVLAADPGIEGITAADFTGDGNADIAYAAYRTPTGWPTTAVCDTGGLLPTLCSTLGGNGLGGDAGVMLNTTPKGALTASFAPPLRLTSGLASVAVISGDFFGDCKPDLAVGNFLASGAAGITIFRNLARWPTTPTCPAKPVAGITPGLGL
jgi:hypothetical protein